MPLETGTFLSDLVVSNPVGSDNKSTADDHLRLIKSTLRATLPNLNGPVTPTPAQLNVLAAPGTTIQSGMLFDFAGLSAPAGYLACDGAAVLRADFPGLFAAIGTAWGAGNGTTTFNIPDLRRRATIGAGGTSLAGPANTVGAVGGAESVGAAGLPLHSHTFSGTTGAMSANAVHSHTDSGHSHSGSVGQAGGTGYAVAQPSGLTIGAVGTGFASLLDANTDHNHAFSGATGNGPGSAATMGLMQPSAVVTKIIKT